MALIKYGSGIVQMSGSIAGDTHARNRYGNYKRARTKPVNPRSSRQCAARLAMMSLTEMWHEDLDAAQRGAWANFADQINWLNRLGEVVHLSGFNHFIRSNAARVLPSLALVSDGPTTMALPQADETFAVAGSAGTGLITVTFDDTEDWCDEDEAGMLIHVGRPCIETRNFFGGPWRYAAVLAGSSTEPPATGETVTSPFTLVEGQKVWCFHLLARADGRLSNRGIAAPFVVGA